MIPALYSAFETQFVNNGLGGLPNAINCIVTEQRNTSGGYYLEMDYPVDGLHYADIIPERFIYASPAPKKAPQPFRIVHVSKPINGIVHIEAAHISQKLQTVTTFGTYVGSSVVDCLNAFKGVANSTGQSVVFYFTSDIQLSQQITVPRVRPAPFSDVLMGAENSLTDIVGGEYEFDKWNVILHRRRGVDTGLEIRYGVNMTDIEAETDSQNLVTAVIPYWSGQINEVDTVVIGDLCRADTDSSFAYTRTIPLDVSDQFDVENNTAPTKAQVTAAGQAFVGKTDLKDLNVSVRVKYTEITSEIGDRPIYLCDTVKVVHPDLKVSTTAKVVEVKFNVLTERYDEITIGSIKQSIVDTIARMIKNGR